MAEQKILGTITEIKNPSRLENSINSLVRTSPSGNTLAFRSQYVKDAGNSMQLESDLIICTMPDARPKLKLSKKTMLPKSIGKYIQEPLKRFGAFREYIFINESLIAGIDVSAPDDFTENESSYRPDDGRAKLIAEIPSRASLVLYSLDSGNTNTNDLTKISRGYTANRARSPLFSVFNAVTDVERLDYYPKTMKLVAEVELKGIETTQGRNLRDVYFHQFFQLDAKGEITSYSESMDKFSSKENQKNSSANRRAMPRIFPKETQLYLERMVEGNPEHTLFAVHFGGGWILNSQFSCPNQARDAISQAESFSNYLPITDNELIIEASGKIYLVKIN